MIFMAPYGEKLNIYWYELPDLRSRINNRITTTKRCLTEITSPVQNPIQEHIHREYIKRIQELTQQANTDISDIEANHRKDIFSTELKTLKTSLHHIEHETSTVYSDLCTWKASQTRPPAGASEEHAAAMETKHTTLAQSPEPDRDGDIKAGNKEDETIDNHVPYRVYFNDFFLLLIKYP